MGDTPSPNPKVDYPTICRTESEEIKNRREELEKRLGSLTYNNPQYVAGLALSGGGIRSACFNLGLIEALDREEVFLQPTVAPVPPTEVPAADDETSKQGQATNGCSNCGPGSQINYPGPQVKTDVRYLELFDYLSAVSGGSYVAGHLAMATLPASSAKYEGEPPDTRLGEIRFDTNSVPQWSWAIGVWFLGFLFQLLKTGSLLIAILGAIALLFRTCDAPDVLRFCDAVGLDSDIKRGFVPFWIMLGVIFISFLLRQKPLRALIWGGVSLGVLTVYSITVLTYEVLKQESSYTWHSSFKWHFACIVLPFSFSLLLLGPWWKWAGKRWKRLVEAGKPADRLRTWMIRSIGDGRERVGTWWKSLRKARKPSRDQEKPAGKWRTWVNHRVGVRWKRLGEWWKRQSNLRSIAEPNKEIFLLPLLTALFCFAGLVTTGDIDLGTQPTAMGTKSAQDVSKILAQWGQRIFLSAATALGLTSLAFVRWRDLLRSTRQVTEEAVDSRWRPVFQVVIFLCSYGLLLLLLFVLYGAVARENVSRYNERRNSIADAALHRSDFVDWDKAWERINDDATLNPTPSWHALAAAILKARHVPDPQGNLSLKHENELANQIQAIEAQPWTTRFDPRVVRLSPEWPYLRLYRPQWPAVATLYERKIEQSAIQNEVAANIATQVLSQKDLYRKLSPATIASIKAATTNPAGGEAPHVKYIRTASHLASLADKGTALQTAIRRNNRQALRLYLNDLVRDRDAKGMEIYASVVWIDDQLTRLRIIGIACILWLLCIQIDKEANTFSLHAFYHDHIRKQWLRRQRDPNGTGWLYDDRSGKYRSGPSRLARAPGEPTSEVDRDEAASLRRAPLLLINATISEGSRSLGNDPNLCLNIFTFSPIAAGSPVTGYWLTSQVEPSPNFVRRNRLDVSQMVAVSGAFLSPGQVANPTLAAIFHVLNVQTGWWVSDPEENPGLVGDLKFHFWQSLGVDRKNDNHYLLTDGAHVENLGLKVLLDRRCSLVVASDCSQDSDLGHPFGALIEVLRQARLDGIQVGPFLSARGYRHWLRTNVIDEVAMKQRGENCRRPLWQGLDLIDTPDVPAKTKEQKEAKPEAEAGVPPGKTGLQGEAPGVTNARLSQEHFLFAHIRYPKRNDAEVEVQEGLLIYLRPSLTGDEGESLVRPGFAGALFPNDPPLDQFYNVARMNSYRLLGRHIGRELTTNPEFRNAMERIVRGAAAVPGRPSTNLPEDRPCLDCLRRPDQGCQAHVDSEFRTRPAPNFE